MNKKTHQPLTQREQDMLNTLKMIELTLRNKKAFEIQHLAVVDTITKTVESTK